MIAISHSFDVFELLILEFDLGLSVLNYPRREVLLFFVLLFLTDKWILWHRRAVIITNGLVGLILNTHSIKQTERENSINSYRSTNRMRWQGISCACITINVSWTLGIVRRGPGAVSVTTNTLRTTRRIYDFNVLWDLEIAKWNEWMLQSLKSNWSAIPSSYYTPSVSISDQAGVQFGLIIAMNERTVCPSI